MCYDVMNIPYLSHAASLLLQVLVPAFTSLSAIRSMVLSCALLLHSLVQQFS